MYPQSETLCFSQPHLAQGHHGTDWHAANVYPSPNRGRGATIKAGLYAKGGLPGVFGAVDGTHVRLWEPKPAALAYMNRKGFHFVNIKVRFSLNFEI